MQAIKLWAAIVQAIQTRYQVMFFPHTFFPIIQKQDVEVAEKSPHIHVGLSRKKSGNLLGFEAFHELSCKSQNYPFLSVVNFVLDVDISDNRRRLSWEKNFQDFQIQWRWILRWIYLYLWKIVGLWYWSQKFCHWKFSSQGRRTVNKWWSVFVFPNGYSGG